MDEQAKYILAHSAYTKALWLRNDVPAEFAHSDDAIVLLHNRQLGDVFAAAQTDFNILYAEYEKLFKAYSLRETKLEVLEQKNRKLQNKVRELSEQIKTTA